MLVVDLPIFLIFSFSSITTSFAYFLITNYNILLSHGSIFLFLSFFCIIGRAQYFVFSIFSYYLSIPSKVINRYYFSIQLILIIRLNSLKSLIIHLLAVLNILNTWVFALLVKSDDQN